MSPAQKTAPKTAADPTGDGRPLLMLLDGHSLAYRAFFALPVENFKTAGGQTTNAVFGFTSMLINLLRDEQPTHLAVAFDKSRQTFRLAEYADYKAGRTTPTAVVEACLARYQLQGSVIATAKGEATRFLSVAKEYSKAPEITRKRLYLDAMQAVLSNPNMEKIIMPENGTAPVLPYLPLDRIKPQSQAGNAQAQGKGE